MLWTQLTSALPLFSSITPSLSVCKLDEKCYLIRTVGFCNHIREVQRILVGVRQWTINLPTCKINSRWFTQHINSHQISKNCNSLKQTFFNLFCSSRASYLLEMWILSHNVFPPTEHRLLVPVSQWNNTNAILSILYFSFVEIQI